MESWLCCICRAGFHVLLVAWLPEFSMVAFSTQWSFGHPLTSNSLFSGMDSRLQIVRSVCCAAVVVAAAAGSLLANYFLLDDHEADQACIYCESTKAERQDITRRWTTKTRHGPGSLSPGCDFCMDPLHLLLRYHGFSRILHTVHAMW